MQTEDPDFVAFVKFLDGARSVPSVQDQKRFIFELLALQPGEKVRDMAQLVGPTGWCVGLDQDEAMIEVAQNRSRNQNHPMEFSQGTIYALDFPENTFDVTRAERLFEHLQQPEQALAEMLRVTRVGGRLLIASPDMDTTLIDHPDRSVTRRIRHFESDRRPNGLAGQRLYGMCWDAGLTDIQVRAVVHMHTSYAEVLSFLDIRERAEAARDGGALTASECAAWLEQLDHAGRAGHFFMSTNHYIVCGRKAS